MISFADPFAHVPLPPSRADRYADLVRQLAQGVNVHRLACVAAGLEPEDHDIALWSLLESLRLPDGPSDDGAGIKGPTLAEVLCRGIWAEAANGGGRG